MSFPSRTHQICLVSEQTLPNYLGAVMPGASPKKLHLIVTPSMRDRADILEQALRCKQYDVEQYQLAQPLPNEMMEVLDAVRQKTGTDMAVNVTGGTKIMALAAVEWASIQDEPPFLFYVDTAEKKVWQIGGRNEQFDLKISLKIKDLLKAGAGADILSVDSTNLGQEIRDALQELVRVFLKNRLALELFNKCAKEAQSSLYADMPHGCIPGFGQALAIAQEVGKLEVASDRILYASQEARIWCNGGWLEDLVKARLYKMKGDGIIDDWASNVEVFKANRLTAKGQKKDLSPQNELDAVFTESGRLFLLECKTANLAKRGGFSAATYKIDSLRKSLGGVFAQGMIVSVLEPRPVDVRRCAELHIELLCCRDVLTFEERIKRWIQYVKS